MADAQPLWAFTDESERAGLMLLGVLILPAGAIHDARRELRGLLLPGQRRIHTSDESARRRRLLLDVIRTLEAQTIIWTLRRPPGLGRVEARDLLLGAAVRELTSRRVVSWLLDGQDPAQQARDRGAIGRALPAAAPGMVYDHRSSTGEPLLWAVDGVVWAVGAGRDWRRRAGEVDVRELHP